MDPRPAWENIDRTAFCENAILLELKNRAQGRLLKAGNVQRTSPASFADGEYPYPIDDFLDDVALIAAGSAGKENVTAACIESGRGQDDCRVLTVRIARNAGANSAVIEEVQKLLGHVSQRTKIEEPDHCILPQVVSRCYRPLKKHADRLARLVFALKLSDLTTAVLPPYQGCSQHYESQEDIVRLGCYSKETHIAFMLMQHNRLHDIATISATLSTARLSPTALKDLERLTRLTYLIRKSTSIRIAIRHRILQLPRRTPNIPKLDDVLHRLGQVSKFARAAHHVAWHIEKMRAMGFLVKVKATPSNTITISELSTRTPSDLRSRGGTRFCNVQDQRLQAMLNRWRDYREHAEIQLIMFYEENNTILRGNYIGCNKLSCFLCFHFMERHGQFHSRGCHQSLYSMWMVRDFIKAKDDATGKKIGQILVFLSEILEQKIRAQHDESWRSLGIACGPESVANLSRLSLAFSQDGVPDRHSSATVRMRTLNAELKTQAVSQSLSLITGSGVWENTMKPLETDLNPSNSGKPTLEACDDSEGHSIVQSSPQTGMRTRARLPSPGENDIAGDDDSVQIASDGASYKHSVRRQHKLQSRGLETLDCKEIDIQRQNQARKRQSKPQPKRHPTSERASRLKWISRIILNFLFGKRVMKNLTKTTRSRPKRKPG